jgi:peptidoglycan/xylan/chitin deacetylase (PgdA/CDA1 family)
MGDREPRRRARPPHRRRDRESDAGWRARVSANIGRSLARIEKEIGTAPTLFAYPYGEYDPELAAMVRGLGLAGFGQQSGAAWSEADRATLPRFPVSGAYADLADLRVKAASLPLPVVEASPDSPVLTQEETRPALTLSIEWGDWSADGLAAYVSGQGGTPVVWADRARGRVRVQANRDLPPGRSRYNVTAPARNGGRWYWYSHPWIRPGGND